MWWRRKEISQYSNRLHSSLVLKILEREKKKEEKRREEKERREEGKEEGQKRKEENKI